MMENARSRNQAALLTDAKGAEEDWTGLSASNRRKLQNRLNQRASRRRRKTQPGGKDHKQDPGSIRRWIVYRDTVMAGSHHDEHAEPTLEAASSETALGSRDKPVRFCELEPAQQDGFLRRMQDIVCRSITQRLLDSELLVAVTQFNMLHAMMSNATRLGLTVELLCEDANSPFNVLLPWGTDWSLPPSLQPTTLQRQIVHHPWIDIYPMASLRDSLLLRMGQYDDDELCHDFFRGGNEGENQAGMVVWGEAWDPASYEISPAVVRRWPWIAHDCPDLITSTNYWRAKRYEEPLACPLLCEYNT